MADQLLSEREEIEKDLKALARKKAIKKDPARLLAVQTLAREQLEARRRKKYLHEQAQLAEEKIRRKREEREKASKIESEIPPVESIEKSTAEPASAPAADSPGRDNETGSSEPEQMITGSASYHPENEKPEKEIEAETTDNQETSPPKQPLIKRKTKRPQRAAPHIELYRNQGWVKLHREQFSHPISNRKPWCEGYAWCYLYSQANHKPGIVNFRNQYIRMERGQLLTSTIKLSVVFGWTRRRTDRYLFWLEKLEMVSIRRSKRFIIISIVNYDRFQSAQGEKGTTESKTEAKMDVQQNENRRTTEAHKQEVKNKEKEKDGNFYSESFESFWKEYPKKNKKRQAYVEWQKLKPEVNPGLEVIRAVLKKQIAYKTKLKASNQFCPEWPDPERWIKGQRWEDEIPVDGGPSSNPFEEAKQEAAERRVRNEEKAKEEAAQQN